MTQVNGLEKLCQPLVKFSQPVFKDFEQALNLRHTESEGLPPFVEDIDHAIAS
jgi:hypothetical protein